MSQTCAKCSRVNPDEAIYCFHDGYILGNLNREGGPVAVGSRPFNSPFVFADGHSCRSFNELARACNDRWPEARGLLQQGLLESFLTGLGRLDLVQAAREARKFPDPDRALDQLLARLPCDKEALAAPQLQVETQEINLGVIEPGTDRFLEIKLENSGERLLYGDATVRVANKQQAWISLDDRPGIIQRSFQFQDRMVLKIHLDRDRVRASDKPLSATIVLDSSGGTSTIEIKAEVPIKPFPEGALQGARTGRRVAELAKAKPKEAAPLFESGAVARWYKSNGWEYPIQGPPASGLGAVQQFFEALGLAPAPKVAINTRRIDWLGPIGSTLEQEIVLQTQEKKYVYAHGVSDHPWLQVERAELKGPKATLKVRVPSVPDRPGETLTAMLTVQSNGTQRFLIPVTLAIPGTPRRGATGAAVAVVSPFAFGDDEPVAVVQAVEAYEDDEVPVVAAVEAYAVDPGEVATVTAVEAFASAAVAEVVSPAVANEADVLDAVEAVEPDEAFAGMDRNTPAALRKEEHKEERTRAERPAREDRPAREEKPASQEKESPRTPRGQGGFLGHLLPLGLLFLALGMLGLWDYVYPEVRSATGASTEPTLELSFDKNNSRYALKVVDPLDRGNTDKHKALFPILQGAVTPTGGTGNVCVRIGGTGKDSTEYLFGVQSPVSKRISQDQTTKDLAWRTIYRYEEFRVEITQEVELVKGPSGAYDTCMVRYTLENKGNAKQVVGLRVLLDTFIGSNDGVPFTIPGEAGFVTLKRTLNQKEIPLYIEAIENPDDLKNPGTVVRLGLQFPDSNLEPPSQVLICGYQNGFRTQKWDLDPIRDIGKDSCVAIYWSDVALSKGEKRTLGYTYGLGEVKGDGRLAVSAPGVVTPGSEFLVTAYVSKAEPGQKFKLSLPQGMSLGLGELEEKSIDARAERTTLSWRVRTGEASKALLPIRVEGAGTQSKPAQVQVRARSIFG